MRLHRTLALALACAALLAPSAAAHGQKRRPRTRTAPAPVVESTPAIEITPAVEITKEKVEAVLRGFDEALAERKLDRVAVHLAPDARISLKLGDAPVNVWTREQYLKLAQTSFERALDYRYARFNTTVTVEPGGRRAVVYSDSFEMMVTPQLSFASKVFSATTFEVRGDKILITLVEGTAVKPEAPAR